ncbi:hypothetical protein GCM10010371_29840 [Streptomyces subrutilus]|uniref:Uncharacterized protein n=1 Tax=Streptomyces subrutilus TaxID=36818 RepID=A0A918QRG2_9ACTN|nr:hypothetical protein GCM10010371_29840 [Streptomyces subrutilus]
MAFTWTFFLAGAVAPAGTGKGNGEGPEGNSSVGRADAGNIVIKRSLKGRPPPRGPPARPVRTPSGRCSGGCRAPM